MPLLKNPPVVVTLGVKSVLCLPPKWWLLGSFSAIAVPYYTHICVCMGKWGKFRPNLNHRLNFKTYFIFHPVIFEKRKWSYSKNIPLLGSVIVCTFLIYPHKHKYMFSRVIPLSEVTPVAVIFGVNKNFVIFTPKGRPTPMVWWRIFTLKVVKYCTYR